MATTLAALREDALAAWRAGVAAVDPEAAVVRALAKRPDLTPQDPRTLVVAAGKAAAGMMRGAARSCGSVARGIVLLPDGFDAGVLPPSVAVLRGGHPYPTREGVAATRRILDEAARLGRGDRLLMLLSGGASALLEAPAEGLSFDDLLAASRELVASGLPIDAINRIRGCLSAVKHGRLALAAKPASVTTLAVSDVPGDDPHAIASAPTLSPLQNRAQTLALAREVVRGALLNLPPRALQLLEEPPAGAELVRSGEQAPADYSIVASSRDAVAGAERALAARGYAVRSPREPELRGDTSVAALRIVEAARSLAAGQHGCRAAAIFGGETTVALHGRAAGLGGRNLDLAARVAVAINGWDAVAVLAAGTDGCDGSSRAAGAVVDGGTATRAAASGLRLEPALAAFDTEPALEAAADLVVSGPTGTNVGDLTVVVLVR